MRFLLLLAAGSLLAACSIHGHIGFQPGVSTEADVRRALGEPAAVIGADDGARQLAYASGPLGVETHMVVVGRDGRVERVQQVLTDDQFARIQPGRSTGEDVLRLIGPPWRRVPFENLDQVAWDYRFRDTWGYLANFSVMMDRNGIVASKFTARIEPGRGFAGTF